MKKGIYILIMIYLIHGKTFADSVNFLKTSELNFTEKTSISDNLNVKFDNNKTFLPSLLSNNPLNDRLNLSSFMKTQNRNFVCCSTRSSFKEFPSRGFSMIYFTPSDSNCVTIDAKAIGVTEVNNAPYLTPLHTINKRLQNINVHEYFYQQTTPDYSYYRGFGIRLTI